MRRTTARKATELTLEDEIAQLRDLDLHGLRARWKTMLRRQPPPHLPRHLLFAVLAYRLQADQMGDITPDTARLLKQIGASRTTADAMCLTSEFDRRRIELKHGSILTREWNGRHHRVMVVEDGFAWNGKTYDSLSDVLLRSPAANGTARAFSVSETRSLPRPRHEPDHQQIRALRHLYPGLE